MEDNSFKYYLRFSGREDSPMFRAAVKHLGTFPLWRDSQAKVVGFKEYDELIHAGEIHPAESYWRIKEGEVGVIHLKQYGQFSKTWEAIGTALSDFESGWRAAERHWER